MHALLVFVTLLALTQARNKGGNPVDALKQIHECQELLTSNNNGFDIPNCNEAVNSCFKEAHGMAPRCIAQDMQHHRQQHGNNAMRCLRGSAMKDAKNAWIASSCLWHNAVVSCMRGDQPNSIFQQHAQGAHASHSHTEAQQHFLRATNNNNCWTQLHNKMQECTNLGVEQCGNFKYCIAQEQPTDDATLSSWRDISDNLKADKHEKMKTFIDKVQACKQATAAGSDESSSATDEPSTD